MTAPVLRGITCSTYRETLHSLTAEGWDIERRPGGHLMLKHPEAATPVFGSSTPSDSHTSKNLLSQCRIAIRTGSETTPDGPESSPEELDAILRRKKFRNRKHKGGLSRFQARPVPYETNITEPPKPADIDIRPGAQFDIKTGRTSNAVIPGTFSGTGKDALPKNEPQADKPRPKRTIAKKKSKPTRKDDTMLHQVIEAEKETGATPKVDETAPQKLAVAASPKRATSLDPAKAASATQASTGIETISPDVLTIARKIASGELQQVTVTADMVGRTILYDGRLILVGDMNGAAPATPEQASASAKPANPETTAMPAETPTPAAQAKSNDNAAEEVSRDWRDNLLLTHIKDLGPDFVSAHDLSLLAWNDLGYKSYASARASIPSRLRRFVKAGELVEGKRGDKKTGFRHAD